MKKRNADGFTLIEIVIAIAVMSAGIVPFMMVLGQNLKVSTTAKQRFIAANYAKELIEEIKLKEFGITTGTLTTNTAISSVNRNGVWTTIDQYKGYDESAISGGSGIREFGSDSVKDTRYFRRVFVSYANPVDFTEMPSATGGTSKLVRVECWINTPAGVERDVVLEWIAVSGS